MTEGLVERGVDVTLFATADAGPAETAAAVTDVSELDRALIRGSVVDRFDVGRMVDDCLSLHGQVLARAGAG